MRSERKKLIWIEDDATTRDPDHEDLKKAWRRLFDEELDLKRATLVEDWGDCSIYHTLNNCEVVVTVPGECAIYELRTYTPKLVSDLDVE